MNRERRTTSHPARLIGALLISAAIVPGAQQAGREPTDAQTTIRAEVALVNVVFTVADRSDRPVSGLKANDFLVFEDGRPQSVQYFNELFDRTEVPLRIALLIDTSGSVKNKLEYEKLAAAEFLQSVLRPETDRGLLMKFDSEVAVTQEFTSDPNRLINALRDLETGNATALYDAVWLAVGELRTQVPRRVIVVMTDGDDTASRIRKDEAIEEAQRADVLIYGIGVRGELGANFGVLKRFAEETGGKFFSPKATMQEIQTTFRAIGRDLRSQYSLAYSSTNPRKDGAFRTIEIRPKCSSCQVRARKGYYAPRLAPPAP